MALKVGVFGESGRMGKKVVSLIKGDSSLELVSALKSQKTDVVIDFSSPEGLLELASWCEKNKVPLVSGTTGLSSAQEKELKSLSAKIPIFWSPNMSVGLNTMVLSLETFSKNLSQGEVSIEEIHHKDKKDSPSGTAKLLHRVIKENSGKNVKLSDPVGLRGGDVIGVHKVYFFLEGEWVAFEHQAGSRAIFAQGAIKAAKWVVKKKTGFYEMKDYIQDSKT